jgi:hypothetical protein
LLEQFDVEIVGVERNELTLFVQGQDALASRCVESTIALPNYEVAKDRGAAGPIQTEIRDSMLKPAG